MPESCSGGEVFLSDLSPKDKPWDKHRAASDKVSATYAAAGNPRYAERIKKCSLELEYVLKAGDLGDMIFRLNHAYFCRVRHCPTCQWRKSLKWKAKFIQAMPAVKEAYPTHRWLFLTLTVRNCELTELRNTINWMNTAFKRLTQLKIFPAVGWTRSIEVTRNSETNQAHPHFHCLLLVPAGYFDGKNYINQEEWTELWKKCLRIEYTPIVHIKAIKSAKEWNFDEIWKAAVEIFKYAVKEEELFSNPEWLSELTNQLHKTKAVTIGGVLRGFLKDEKDDDDLIHVEESIILDEEDTGVHIFFGWRERVERYVQKRESILNPSIEEDS